MATLRDEEELWRRWHAGDEGARAALVAGFAPYGKAIAARLYARRPLNDVEFEEYEQFAMVGLLEAVDRYRCDRGARFTTFAMPRIRGAVLSGVERATERRQQSAFRRRVLSERVASMVGDEDALPAEALLADLAKVGVGVALGLLLDGTCMVQRDEGLPDGAYAQVELRSVHAQVWGLAKELTEREREVLEGHYRDGLRFEEVARKLGITKGRVSQLHQQALARLRGLLAASQGCDVAY
jgi:RNA polymerase sigma factor for flagellar operon FliA